MPFGVKPKRLRALRDHPSVSLNDLVAIGSALRAAYMLGPRLDAQIGRQTARFTRAGPIRCILEHCDQTPPLNERCGCEGFAAGTRYDAESVVPIGMRLWCCSTQR